MVKIRVISNNNALEGFTNEHGFSVLIETETSSTLLDTGSGEAFIHNINILSIDISNIDSLVLSHGHFDHCGNINYILNNNNRIKIYHHPQLLVERYSIHKDRDPMVKFIGVNEVNKKSLKNCHSFLTEDITKISNNIFITGSIPRLSNEDTGGPFFFDTIGEKRDLILDDQAIWLNTKKGLLIITGCCHSGIINTVEYIKKYSGIDRVYGIVGGLHLSKALDKRVIETTKYLNSLSLTMIAPGHCTGDHIVEKLKKDLNCRVIDVYAGLDIILDVNID